ncbi:hypothetical protein [Paenibacillus pabuli]|uniref:hypothetical protein n=1 Tax=Paenibacillus pabuli TaxID=1472 RepID=UPI0032424C85
MMTIQNKMYETTVKAVGGRLCSLFDSALNRVARMQKNQVRRYRSHSYSYFGKWKTAALASRQHWTFS